MTTTDARDHYGALLGASSAMQRLYSLLDRVCPSSATVLVTGENGTGKELVARAIHDGSPRGKKPFVIQNCSAFNDNLLESELFGHVKGAFTGAVTDKPGLFEIADGGTFFLDEVGDMSPALQVKLLRVIQEGTFTPVGSIEEKHVDVRVVAATHRDMLERVESGQFREDLYYRLNVLALGVPALRDRGQDIALLARAFLTRQDDSKHLTENCIAALMRYHWPGNVRQLQNEIERAVVLCGETTQIEASMLSATVKNPSPDQSHPVDLERLALPEALRILEKRMIVAALARTEGNKTRAAEQLKISRRNLIRLAKKHDL